MTQCIRGHTLPNPALTNTPLLTSTRAKTTLHAYQHLNTKPPNYHHGQDQGEAPHWQQPPQVTARERRVSGKLNRPCRHHRRYQFPLASHRVHSPILIASPSDLSVALPAIHFPLCHHTNPPPENRDSIDSELAAMPPHERVAYLQEFEHSDKHDEPKRGGLIEKLIARGNKRTEEQLAREAREREEAQKQATHATMGPGVGASAHSAAGPTTDPTLR
jgi:hypothetical protein